MTRTRTLLASAIAATLLPATASGAGFGLIQHSAKTGGTAYAGTATSASDPATVFFNPAGMVRNEGQAVSGVISYVAPEFDFEDGGSTYPAPPAGSPDRGQLTNTSDETGFPPALYYMTQFRDDWAFGLAINAPFGSRTDYDDDWVGRYNGVESEIQGVNINPNLSHQINDRVSVGFGINAQYFDATLSSKVPNTEPANGPVFNPATDSEIEIKGSSWAAGVNAGILVDATERTQIGFAWRSQVKQSISNGEVTFTGPDGSLLDEQDGRASIDLPESFTLSLRHEPAFDDRLAILVDAAYTRWSRVDTINVRPDEDVAGEIGEEELSLNLDFQNSWRGAIGATWDQTDRLQLRTGFAFDQSAVRNSELRTPRVPDNHRRWFSLGAGYQVTQNLELDASYSHLSISDTRINNTDEATGATLTGTFDSSADILSAQATYRF